MAIPITVRILATGFLHEALRSLLAPLPCLELVDEDAAVGVLYTGDDWRGRLNRFRNRSPRAEATSIVLLTGYNHSQLAAGAVLGVRVFVDPEDSLEEFLHALERAALGEAFCSHSLQLAILKRMSSDSDRLADSGTIPGITSLTERQLEVARLAATLASTREIAARLCLSEPTVKTHLLGAYRKLGVRSRAQLFALLQMPARTEITLSPIHR